MLVAMNNLVNRHINNKVSKQQYNLYSAINTSAKIYKGNYMKD